MVATHKAPTKKTMYNPLEGNTGIKVFVGLVLVGLLLAFLECSEDVACSSQLRVIILQIYIFIVGVGWYIFAASSSKEHLFENAVFYYLLCGPIIAMSVTQSAILFWISLVLVVIWGVGVCMDNVPKEVTGWKSFLVLAYAAWVIVGAVITLGSTSLLPYAQPALALSEIHLLLDARVLLTCVLSLLFIGDAMVEGFNEGIPNIRPLPDIRISESTENYDPLVASIMQALITIINVLLLVIQKTTNVVWHLIALVSVYLYRTGRNLANHVLDVLFTTRIWLSIVRVVLSFIALVIFASMVVGFTPTIVEYLRANTSLFYISANNAWTLIVAAAIFALVLAVVVLLSALWGYRDRGLHQGSFAGAMILVAFWISGGLLYVLSYLKISQIVGFQFFGLYSLLLALFVGSIFIFQIAKRVTA